MNEATKISSNDRFGFIPTRQGCFFIMNLQMTDRESDMLNDGIVLNEDLLLAMVMYAD